MTYIRFVDSNSLSTFTKADDKANVSIAAAPDSQERSCKVFFPEGSHHGASLTYDFREANNAEPESMFASYLLYIDESFDPTSDGKLPGFAGRYTGTERAGGWGGRKTTGTNGWSARGLFHPPDTNGNIPIGNYVYHADMDSYGTHALWDTTLEPGRWHKIDQYIELNTPGENDGVLRGLVDQTLVYDSDDWRWRDTDDIRIQQFWANFYHGGNEPVPQDMALYMDSLYLKDESL